MVTPALIALLAVPSILASPHPAPYSPSQELALRALSDKSYAPYKVDCPTGWTWIRNATEGLASGERDFIANRQKVTGPAINTMASSHGIANPPRTPTIGVALAGGGYRAMLTGLGGIMGMMNESSEGAASGLGGWLDGVTYWAGLSGGSWATGSFMSNGGELPINLLNNLWNLDSNLVFPSDDKLSFYTTLVSETNAKSDAGFPTQLTDLWGLAIGSHVLPSQYQLTNSPNLTFSSLPSVVQKLGNGSLPMPIIIAAEREQGELVIAENATVWEFTPFEFGSWAFGSEVKSIGAFTNLEYLGSELNNGQTNGTCWKGFDQLSFVMGTSATLFNSALLQINNSDSGLVTDLIQGFLENLGEDQQDIARIPNSFANYNPGENPISSFEYITLVDAGETNQNIPIEPLLIPFREVDAIIAFDSSYDSPYVWPNGTALRTTFERAKVLAENTGTQIRMPEVPSENGFINGGYNTRPTFFGCNDTTTPLIVYVPSYPWSAAANTSTYQLEYSDEQAREVLYNGLRSLTLNGTVETWPRCLACALTDRSFEYTSSNRTAECQSCFDTWCWAGDDNTTQPNTYEPQIASVPPWLTARGLSSGKADAKGVENTQSTSSASMRVVRGAGGWMASLGVGMGVGLAMLS
ncbi:phospholipase B [Kwoniella bestiolae CBS 10118]|uniref:Lysophospholipase n=1 Tax=Kwoniella bestiolae CBS 10118 TaxID=1296100 RepID=A0A1B9GFD1_9TREE|nr:phospholipase B [Kwoniella bestiolae CBS 10118]OCF29752.1 phospholipase B [Kwoniella bestiolae CBS 10118]